MRSTIAAGLIVGVVFALAGVAEAGTHRVPGDFASVNDAIDAASAGDKILVSEGALATGIVVSGKSRLTIVGQGDPVYDMQRQGVSLLIEDSDRIKVSGFVFESSLGDCVQVFDSDRVTLDRCTMRDADASSIRVDECTGLRLLRNTIDGVSGRGVYLTTAEAKAASSGAKLIANEVSGCIGDAISLTGGGHLLKKNVVDACDGSGITVERGDATRILRNVVRSVGGDGIYVDGSRNKIIKNEVTGTGDDALAVYGNSNKVTKNIVTDADDDGIEVEDATGTRVIKNTITGSGDNGIQAFRASGNVFQKNAISGSGAFDLRDLDGPDANTWKKNSYTTEDFTPIG